MTLSALKQEIFNIRSAGQFDSLCMEIFRFQAAHCAVYHRYLQLLEIEPDKISRPEEIPALPIRFFKTQKIVSNPFLPAEDPKNPEIKEEIVFTSSSTTGMIPSKHFVLEKALYETSFLKGFELFYGRPQEYTILALLPSYLERKGSSLVYMAEHLIRLSGNGPAGSSASGFYLSNHEDLRKTLLRLKEEKKKTILLGVSFALLDFTANYRIRFPELIVIETGGMKGRGKEIGRDELHRILSEGFGVKEIHSEYGMAELLSQAYSTGKGIFETPPWMRIYIRDLYDPFRYLSADRKGSTGEPDHTPQGGINIIDLANIGSCCFIETEDTGRLYSDGSFSIDGRIKDSELRGCNLLLET